MKIIFGVYRQIYKTWKVPIVFHSTFGIKYWHSQSGRQLRRHGTETLAREFRQKLGSMRSLTFLRSINKLIDILVWPLSLHLILYTLTFITYKRIPYSHMEFIRIRLWFESLLYIWLFLYGNRNARICFFNLFPSAVLVSLVCFFFSFRHPLVCTNVLCTIKTNDLLTHFNCFTPESSDGKHTTVVGPEWFLCWKINRIPKERVSGYRVWVSAKVKSRNILIFSKF